MRGYFAAKQVVLLGRKAFFCHPNDDLPYRQSQILNEDDLTPQFGFVSENYESKRVLLLGINPGNGRRNDRRSAEDERMMPAIRKFAKDPAEGNFDCAMQAYRRECQSWAVWKRHCSEVLGAGKLGFEQIAYSNCLPWRTQSQSAFEDSVAAKAAKLYVEPLLEELRPSVVIAMGKRARAILEITGFPADRAITWNRAQAATETVRRDRALAAGRIFEMLDDL